MGGFREDLYEQISALYETAADALKSFLSLAKEIWPLLFLLLIGLSVLLWIAKPAPPKKVWMASGAGGSYKQIGEKYREYFKKRGIDLIVLPTHGSQENLQHLIDPKDPVRAALVQGGIITPDQAKLVNSLGTIDYEPVWVFYRANALDERRALSEQDLSKLKINIGPKGSGTNVQARNILSINHLNIAANLLEWDNADGVDALEQGKIDAVILVDGFESENVQKLIKSPHIFLANFSRADAYSRLLPYYEELTVPMGGFNLGDNTPARPIELISTTTNLLIDARLHPAIQVLFLEAAREINGTKSYFSKAGQFPSYLNNEAPISEEARYFYQNGPSPLMKYLPFWLAEFIQRMIVLLLPFAAFAYPIIKSIPSYRSNLARKHINSIYKELDHFEKTTLANYDSRRLEEYIAVLNAMEEKVLASKSSKLATAECYSLRSSIEFIRNALEKQRNCASE